MQQILAATDGSKGAMCAVDAGTHFSGKLKVALKPRGVAVRGQKRHRTELHANPDRGPSSDL